MGFPVLLATTSTEPELVTPLWIGVSITLTFLSFGLPAMALGIRAILYERQIAGWPKAQGVVTSSEMTVTQVSHRDSGGRDVYSDSHTAVVTYVYTVDDVMHETGTLTRVPKGRSHRATTQAQVDKYPVGSEVSVFYNPDDPTEGYLESQTSVGGIILTLMGALFAGIGVFTLVMTWSEHG